MLNRIHGWNVLYSISSILNMIMMFNKAGFTHSKLLCCSKKSIGCANTMFQMELWCNKILNRTFQTRFCWIECTKQTLHTRLWYLECWTEYSQHSDVQKNLNWTFTSNNAWFEFSNEMFYHAQNTESNFLNMFIEAEFTHSKLLEVLKKSESDVPIRCSKLNYATKIQNQTF